MDKTAAQLQERQFGFMHRFHVERTERLLNDLAGQFGDGVLGVAEKSGVDRYALYHWHIQRTVALVDAVTAAYGPGALTAIRQSEAADRMREGRELAEKEGDNSLQALVKIWTGGRDETVAHRTETEAVIRTRGCFAARAAMELGQTDLIYALHCNTDADFVRGFNPDLDCEVRFTVMDGQEYCEHRLFVKR